MFGVGGLGDELGVILGLFWVGLRHGEVGFWGGLVGGCLGWDQLKLGEFKIINTYNLVCYYKDLIGRNLVRMLAKPN